MISVLKTRLRLLIELLPFGRDLFLWLVRSRQSISYRGYFDSKEQAQLAINDRKNSQYDVINRNKAANIDREEAKLDSYFKDTDYPAFFWLTQCLEENTHVLELGGSLGHYYYACQRFHMLLGSMSWTIAELPEAVALGESIASKRGENSLGFIDSRQIGMVRPANLFLTAGTLQYMEKSLCDILRGLRQKPEHVVVHHLPVHKKKAYWTLQALSLCEVPYRVYGYQQLVSEMEQLNYVLVKEWRYPRYIEIPFKRRKTAIEGYLGFYFKLGSVV
jgi:putative methyltransferase (TIGR04325 family)